jgi:hypothetical protein
MSKTHLGHYYGPAPSDAELGIGTTQSPFDAGEFVCVDNPRFHGYGIVDYVIPAQPCKVAVRLENGNTWHYDASTVRAVTPEDISKIPCALKEQ